MGIDPVTPDAKGTREQQVAMARLTGCCRICCKSIYFANMQPGWAVATEKIAINGQIIILHHGREFAHVQCYERESKQRDKGQ